MRFFTLGSGALQAKGDFKSVEGKSGSGDVKLELDGTTATNPPAGYYFPQMVMDLNIKPGVANSIMAAMQARPDLI